MNNNINDIKKKALPLLINAGVIRSSIFGSFARGENNIESDIDMLVEFPKGKSLLDLVRLERQLESTLFRKVDLLTYNSISPLIQQSITENQVQIL